MTSSVPASSGLTFSCEFFPPKGPKGLVNLDRAVQNLRPLNPELFTVTYGAGGSTRSKSQEIVAQLAASETTPTAGHIACVGTSKEVVHATIDGFEAAGVRSLVAVRGDQPKNREPIVGGYETAAELVAAIRQRTGGDELDIAVGGYPETHPKAASAQADIESLKEKVDAGADSIITQFFLDNADFYRFRETVVAAGITVPIIPGILPIGNLERNAVFASKCGARVPDDIRHEFEGLAPGGTIANMVGVSICVDQCRDLARNGVQHFHFYTMNRGEMTAAVWRRMIGALPGNDKGQR